VKCLAPWTNIDIGPTGTIKPCCKFNTDYYSVKHNVLTHSLTDYVTSDLINSIKDELTQDKFPAGCERCRIDEESNIESKRQLDYARWQEHYDNYYPDDGFITASIAFGNTCNLTCIMCSPKSSSKWRTEWQDLYNEDIPNIRDAINDTFVLEFLNLSPKLIHIDIPGGEPFLSQTDKQKQLLRHYVNTGQAPNMTLHYTTNVQLFPDEEFWELWTQFKEIDMQLSIDGLNKQFEYIRYPAKWDTLLEITTKYIKLEKSLSNLRLSVSHTVSAYNIYYLDEFFNWCKRIGLPKPYTGRVHTPVALRPEVLNHPTVINKLQQSDWEEVRNWAKVIVNNTADLNEFIRRTERHDNYRGNDFYKTFPELNNILKEIYNDN
jgi:MoaA/NifB/PqqE/SkfB family radical SAM enzyme